ncbi:MAG: hypothetical protein NTW25_11150 [Candidatus Kapabacteria bacterium]|nr:hypothetical protein [Candidatus Kapabacteria bacterium]
MESNEFTKIKLRIAYYHDNYYTHPLRKNHKYDLPIPPQYDAILDSKDLIAKRFVIRKYVDPKRYPDYNKKDEVIVEYNSIDEMADDGWNLLW